MIFGGVQVVVALHGGAAHIADDVEAGSGVGVVADDITQADVIGHALACGIGEDGFESLKVGMDITE
jgi:hypothetical protein